MTYDSTVTTQQEIIARIRLLKVLKIVKR